MKTLRNRIRRLAAIIHVTPPCPACGYRNRSMGPVTFRAFFCDNDKDLGPERCPGCGRVLVYRLEFDDAPDPAALHSEDSGENDLDTENDVPAEGR